MDEDLTRSVKVLNLIFLETDQLWIQAVY